MRRIGAGDTTGVFTMPDGSGSTSTGCPDGYHYVPDPGTVIRGLASPLRGGRRRMAAIGACVPDAPAVATPAPVLAPAITASFPSALLPTPAASCPALWPWWWLLVAAAAGGGVGYYIKTQPKKRGR